MKDKDLREIIKELDKNHVPEPYFYIDARGKVHGPFGKTVRDLDREKVK